MGIALAPEPAATDPLDPTKPKKPAVAPLGVGPSVGPSPSLGLAPMTPPRPASMASAAPPPAMTPPAIPAPTIAAPSAPVDRVKLATDAFNTSAASTQGAYSAAQRSTEQRAAGLGQLASGGLRTSEGNLQLARERDLDALRAKLVNDATTGSVADATTAFQQALAGSQQGLAAELGRANVSQGQQAQDTSRLATTGSLGLQQGSLELERQKADQADAINRAGLTGILNGTETLAAKQQAIQAAIASGQLSVEQGKLALDTLAQSQGHEVATAQLGLAREQTQVQKEQAAAALALQEKLGLSGLDLEQQKVLLAKKAQEINAAYQSKQIDLATRNTQLAELAQAQQNTLETGKLGLAREGQSAQLAQEQQKIDLAKIAQGQSVDLAQQGLDINRMSADTAAKAQSAMEAYQNKQITLGERDATLKELAQAQSNTIETGKLQLAQTGQSAQLAQEQQKIDLAALSQRQSVDLAQQGIDVNKISADTAAKAQKALEDYQSGQLSLGGRDAALKELAQSQGHTIAQGQLGLEQQKVDLARLSEADQHAIAAAGINVQQMDATTARRAQEATAAYQAGTITLGQRDATLKELANAQQNTIATGQLDLAKKSEADANAANVANITGTYGGPSAADKAAAIGWDGPGFSNDIDGRVQRALAGGVDPATVTARLQQDGWGAEGAAQIIQRHAAQAATGTVTLAKQQLDQTGKQFGLSLAQQKDLAELADKTQNKQINVSGAQGRNTLLLELARIMGSKDLNLDKNFLAAIGKALGVALPGAAAAAATVGTGESTGSTESTTDEGRA